MKTTELYKMRIFSREEVMSRFEMSRDSVAGALQRWQKQELVTLIRRNMYSVMDLSTGKALADTFEIATRISPSAYVGWHSALEFHGLAHQPFYTMFVGSETRFNNFRFDNVEYQYCKSPLIPSCENGIVTPMGNPYVRVTDLERTIVDCCDKIDRAGGAEELLHCMEAVVMLDEDKMLHYLSLYDKAFLYQKVGFMLETIQEQAHISSDFISICQTRGAISPQRLTNGADSNKFVSRWRLYVPEYCVTLNQAEYELI